MSRAATARLFVAVELPREVREQLREWARSAVVTLRAAGAPGGALRVLDADSLHLTMCFLGSRPVAEIEALAGVLASCEGRAGELSLGAPLWLPPRRPHALAVEVRDRAGELSALHERLGEELASVSGWLPERRRFTPHVTVARVRRGGRRRPRRGATATGDPAEPARERALPATPRLSFAPEALVLFRSWLRAEGASYEPLASRMLALH